MQLGNSCHLCITEFALRVDCLVRSNPNGLYNMHFGLVFVVSLRQAYRGSRILWPCGRAVILSHHPNLVGVLANSSFPFVFSLLHLFFFPFCFFATITSLQLPPPPPSRHALLGSAGQLLLVTNVTAMTTLIICSYDKKVRKLSPFPI